MHMAEVEGLKLCSADGEHLCLLCGHLSYSIDVEELVLLLCMCIDCHDVVVLVMCSSPLVFQWVSPLLLPLMAAMSPVH